MSTTISISIKNAGLVLLSAYIPVFFDRLGVTDDRKRINQANQSDAVHYLQYLVTGLSKTDESLLPLNKILCGIPMKQPVQDGVDITAAQKELTDALITGAISNWRVIGNSTIEGFRDSWLIRDGLLSDLEDKWELKVAIRPYDMLIARLPFSFSIIKYPWMDKPLHVDWA